MRRGRRDSSLSSRPSANEMKVCFISTSDFPCFVQPKLQDPDGSDAIFRRQGTPHCCEPAPFSLFPFVGTRFLNLNHNFLSLLLLSPFPFSPLPSSLLPSMLLFSEYASRDGRASFEGTKRMEKEGERELTTFFSFFSLLFASSRCSELP